MVGQGLLEAAALLEGGASGSGRAGGGDSRGERMEEAWLLGVAGVWRIVVRAAEGARRRGR